MNIRRDIANIALSKAGEPSLQDDDTTSRDFLLIKKHYLATILEALADVPWTSAKKRVALIEDTVSTNLTKFDFQYTLPIDCEKPLELQGNIPFQIEGRMLYTSIPDAVLAYITNGKLPIADQVETDDYPEYAQLEFEVKFWEYVETRIGYKICFELTGKNDLAQYLRADATDIGLGAERTSKAGSASKKNPSPLWTDRMRGR